MNSTRMAILGVAAAAGMGCVGVLLHGMAGAKPRIVTLAPAAPAVDPHPTVKVLVAQRELNVGDRIQASDLSWHDWPADDLNPDYVTMAGPAPIVAPGQGQFASAANKVADAARTAMTSPSEGAGAAYVGGVVRERIAAREPITAAKVVRAGGSGVMAVSLDPGMRAVALPLTPESAAGGFIQPGDHVDVLMTRPTETSSPNPANAAATTDPTHGFVTTVVIRNVRVMAIDQNMGQPKTSAAIGATATVEATPRQAEYLVLAKASGSISLMLRSYADIGGGSQIGRTETVGPRVVQIYRGVTPTSTPVTVSP